MEDRLHAGLESEEEKGKDIKIIHGGVRIIEVLYICPYLFPTVLFSNVLSVVLRVKMKRRKRRKKLKKQDQSRL